MASRVCTITVSWGCRSVQISFSPVFPIICSVSNDRYEAELGRDQRQKALMRLGRQFSNAMSFEIHHVNEWEELAALIEG